MRSNLIAMIKPSKVLRQGMLGLAAWMTTLAFAPPLQASDAETRVALLVNFARYAEWPAGQSPLDKGAWNLCADASDPALVDALQSVDTQPLYELPIHVKIVRPRDDLSSCHLLFLSARMDDDDVSTNLLSAKGTPTLTVSDHPEFSQMGGMIELVIDDGRYQFDVDYSRVLQSNLRLASGMLKLARRVR